jgi:hypothetical protein
VVNASVEFDLETLRPTYHLTIGLPGRSNALAIAQRLGCPEIIEGGASELDPTDLRAEDLLDEIHRQRDLAIRLGDKVRLRSLNMQGVVTSLGEEEAEVQVGALRIRTRLAELSNLGGKETGRNAARRAPQAQKRPAVEGGRGIRPRACRDRAHPPRRAWSWTCAASAPMKLWKPWTATWMRPTWRDCLSCASSTARAPASCASSRSRGCGYVDSLVRQKPQRVGRLGRYPNRALRPLGGTENHPPDVGGDGGRGQG